MQPWSPSKRGDESRRSTVRPSGAAWRPRPRVDACSAGGSGDEGGGRREVQREGGVAHRSDGVRRRPRIDRLVPKTSHLPKANVRGGSGGESEGLSDLMNHFLVEGGQLTQLEADV